MYQKLNKKAVMHVLNKILCTYLPSKTLPQEIVCLKIRDQFPETSETDLDPPLTYPAISCAPSVIQSSVSLAVGVAKLSHQNSKKSSILLQTSKLYRNGRKTKVVFEYVHVSIN